MEKDKDSFFLGKKFFQISSGFIVLTSVSVICILLVNKPELARELDFIIACGYIGGVYVFYRVARFWDI